MALRYRYAGVFTLTTFTIILDKELCSAETFQPEQNRSYQCPTFFLTSCIFSNWTHRYSVSICKTDDCQDCRPGLAERCSRPRLHELQEGARRAAVGRVTPTGRTCTQTPGGIWPDGNAGGIDNYPVCLRHSGQQSHTYYCLLLSVSWFCRCPCHRATCVMTISVSTLLADRYGCNCLYLN